MTHKVGPKGQVVIPKELREEFGIQPGDEVTFWRDGDHVAVRPARSDRPLKGRFAGRELVETLERKRAVVRRDEGEDEAQAVVRDMRARVDLDLPSEQRVLEAARLKADHPIAYADAFAAATAISHDAVLLTGDPELLVESAPWSFEDLRG